MTPPRLPDSFFEAMYDVAPDPWGFRSRWYERRKRALTLAALPRQRYRSGFEPGCSIGLLTEELAERCDRLVATDVSAAALGAAASRLGHREGVDLRRWALGDPWPADRFDLIMLSEICYYLTAPSLRAVLAAAVTALDPGGTLLAVHWRHPVPDYPLTGDEVHAIVADAPGLARTARYLDDDLVLEVYAAAPPPPASVAAAEGLL